MSDKDYDNLKLKNQLCFPLYAASREVIKQYRPHLDALGLTYTQYIVMMVFWEKKKMNVKELGESFLIPVPSLPFSKVWKPKVWFGGIVHPQMNVC